MVKRLLGVLAALVLMVGVSACGGSDEEPAATDEGSTTDGEPCTYLAGGEAAKEVDLPPDRAAYDGDVAVTIETSAGDIPATLDAAAAPCTVNSFTSLAEQGYFDDTPCPRVTTEGLFVLQCGDPTGTGGGGPGYTFDDELTGEETYTAGTLAMANAGPGTNGSQFFIVYDESGLQPDYTVFGTVEQSGIDIVAGIAAEGSDNSNPAGGGAPNTPIDITAVTVG